LDIKIYYFLSTYGKKIDGEPKYKSQQKSELEKDQSRVKIFYKGRFNTKTPITQRFFKDLDK